MRFPVVIPMTLSASKNTFPYMFQNVKVEKLVKFQTLVIRMVFLSISETLWYYILSLEIIFPSPVPSNGYCIIQNAEFFLQSWRRYRGRL